MSKMVELHSSSILLYSAKPHRHCKRGRLVHDATFHSENDIQETSPAFATHGPDPSGLDESGDFRGLWAQWGAAGTVPDAGVSTCR